jgi:hypothetical protein
MIIKFLNILSMIQMIIIKNCKMKKMSSRRLNLRKKEKDILIPIKRER